MFNDVCINFNTFNQIYIESNRSRNICIKYDEFGCIIIRFMGVHISNFDELCRISVISAKVTRARVEYDRSNDVCIESGEFGLEYDSRWGG